MSDIKKNTAEAREIADRLLARRHASATPVSLEELEADRRAMLHAALDFAGRQLIALARKLEPPYDPRDMPALSIGDAIGAPAQAALVAALGLACGELKLEDFRHFLFTK